MVVLTADDLGSVEVRLKKYPLENDSYFEEYVKVGDRDGMTNSKYRYVIAEAESEYCIEVAVKAGFKLDENTHVLVEVFHKDQRIVLEEFDGSSTLNRKHCTKADMVYLVKDTQTVASNGRVFQGARLTFENLSIGKLFMISLVQ
jgi:hypothetical protein